MKIDNYLTTNEASKKLCVSANRIRAFVKTGRLVPVRLGRMFLFKVEDIENFIRLKAGRPLKNKISKTLKFNPTSGLEREN